MIKYCLLLLSVLFLVGCATVSSMPKSAKDVNFNLSKEGKTGWSRYEEYAKFESTDLKTVYDAAKAGLASADFILKRADYDNRVVIGEHGITMYDWNIVAGVYMKEIPNGVEVKVHVEGSKDIGITGDATGDNWTAKILSGMRSYIFKQKQQ